jgi:hypothetical protein
MLAPIMVIVKYMTGWAIVPKPAWVNWAQGTLQPLLAFSSPPGLWIVYGTGYTIALVLMLVGMVALSGALRDERGRFHTRAYSRGPLCRSFPPPCLRR